MTREQQIDLAAFILRLALGSMFIAHGFLKVMVFTLPGTAQFFDSVGFAGWMAYPVTLLEILGGTLLVLGVATRWIAIALIPVLLGALFVHLGNGWLYTNANGGWEYAAVLSVACVVQVLLGGGTYTLRQLIPGVGKLAQT
ncbi:MAG: DoxX family protein [Gammaproteobacteria bacterium]|nr:DoxX family protein [Gammaproteobacteria bacterium]